MTKDDFFDLILTANLIVFLHDDEDEEAKKTDKAIKKLFAKAKRETADSLVIETINGIRHSPCVTELMKRLYNEFNREI